MVTSFEVLSWGGVIVTAIPVPVNPFHRDTFSLEAAGYLFSHELGAVDDTDVVPGGALVVEGF